MAPRVGSMDPGPFIFCHEASEKQMVCRECLLIARATFKLGSGDIIRFRVLGASWGGRLSSPGSLKGDL